MLWWLGHTTSSASPPRRRIRRDPALWARLVANGMAKDFSWNRAAAEYHGLYETLVGVGAR